MLTTYQHSATNKSHLHMMSLHLDGIQFSVLHQPAFLLFNTHAALAQVSSLREAMYLYVFRLLVRSLQERELCA